MQVYFGDQDITPGTGLRQALLAVLLMAPGKTRARKRLQTMFWGSAGARQASGNLRNAIYMLKRDLKPFSPDCVMSNSDRVWLQPGLFSLSPEAPEGPDFLEGMDLSLEDCQEFEEWLSSMRIREPATSRKLEHFASSAQSHGMQRERALGLLAPICATVSDEDRIRIEILTDAIVRAMHTSSEIPVHDLRGGLDFTFRLPVELGQGPTHLLQSAAVRHGSKLTIRLRLFAADSPGLKWMSDPIDFSSDWAEEIAFAQADHILTQLERLGEAGQVVDLFPYTALTALFSLDPELIGRTERQLSEMAQESGRPILECLNSLRKSLKPMRVLRGSMICTAYTSTTLLPRSRMMTRCCRCR